jgi:hypothetical protein
VNGVNAQHPACLSDGRVSLEWLFEPPADLSGPATSAASPASAGATAMRGSELGALTARGLVDALNKTDFAVANPLDTAAQECPSAGCDQSIVTDALRVKSFSTTSRAQTYAGNHGLFQVETIVVAFAAPVSQAEQDRYRTQIQTLMQWIDGIEHGGLRRRDANMSLQHRKIRCFRPCRSSWRCGLQVDPAERDPLVWLTAWTQQTGMHWCNATTCAKIRGGRGGRGSPRERSRSVCTR